MSNVFNQVLSSLKYNSDKDFLLLETGKKLIQQPERPVKLYGLCIYQKALDNILCGIKTERDSFILCQGETIESMNKFITKIKDEKEFFNNILEE